MICSLLLSRSIIALQVAFCSVAWLGQAPIHFQEETISLCHPERSEGSLAGQRSFAALRMTLLYRLRLTRTTSYLKCIGACVPLRLSYRFASDDHLWRDYVSVKRRHQRGHPILHRATPGKL